RPGRPPPRARRGDLLRARLLRRRAVRAEPLGALLRPLRQGLRVRHGHAHSAVTPSAASCRRGRLVRPFFRSPSVTRSFPCRLWAKPPSGGTPATACLPPT